MINKKEANLYKILWMIPIIGIIYLFAVSYTRLKWVFSDVYFVKYSGLTFVVGLIIQILSIISSMILITQNI